MSNPFTLETDNKKFFTGLSGTSLEVIYQNDAAQQYANRIKNMNEQLEDLARKRQEMLFKQSQMDYIFKRQKPQIELKDFITSVPNGKNDKKFRVRSLLKEKKESIHDFLNKKKEIYLSKMNINIKKEETSKLADSIRDEQETLKARQLYFENDVEFMHRFIDGIKKQAEEAQAAVDAELKQQEALVSKLNGLEAEIEKIDNLISKDTEILESLEKYKNFIEGLYKEKGNPSWKPYTPKSNEEILLFMTEGGAHLSSGLEEGEVGFTIKYEPANMIEIFNNSEEANIREIQKLQDKEDELETVKMVQREEEAQLAQVIRENEERISVLEKNCARKAQDCSRLRQMRKINNNKISVLDNQNLDIQKLKSKVFSIYEQVNPKRAQEIELVNNQTEIKRQMTEIEGDIQKLRLSIKHQKQSYPHLIVEIERDIKNKQKEENIRRNQEENKKMEIKKQQEQEKKRSQAQNEKPKGRRDMEKVMLKKKPRLEKKVQVEEEDYDQKYMKDE